MIEGKRKNLLDGEVKHLDLPNGKRLYFARGRHQIGMQVYKPGYIGLVWLYSKRRRYLFGEVTR